MKSIKSLGLRPELVCARLSVYEQVCSALSMVHDCHLRLAHSVLLPLFWESYCAKANRIGRANPTARSDPTKTPNCKPWDP